MSKTITELAAEKWPDGLPTNRIAIEAPIGSGKTHWVLHELPKQGRVLFICSRRAIKEQAKEIARKGEFAGLNLRIIGEKSEHPFYPRLTIAHAWDIDKDKFRINPKHYDIIVIDEAHMLLTDAFTDVIPNLYSWCADHIPDETKIIMMSATLRVIKDSLLAEGYQYFDWYDEAKHVPTKSIQISLKATVFDILNAASEDNKIIYYCVSAKRAIELDEELKSMGKRSVAVTSSPQYIKNLDKRKDQQQEQAITESALHKEQRLPDNFDIILTTSRLREGINIHDERVKTVITELLDSVSLVQVAGRVRSGVETLMLLYNKSLQHDLLDSDFFQMMKLRLEYRNLILDECRKGYPQYETYIIEDFQKLYKVENFKMVFYNKRSCYFEVNPHWLSYYNELIANKEQWKESCVEYTKATLRAQNVQDETNNGKKRYVRDTFISFTEGLSVIEGYTNLTINIATKNVLLGRLGYAGFPKRHLDSVLALYGKKSVRSKDKRHFTIVDTN